jgi:hypothetical protein
MRQIRTLEDAQIAIRELYSFYDLLKSKDIDMQRRRVKNASPSEEPYDYVVRKELQPGGKLFEDISKKVKDSGSGSAQRPDRYSVIFTIDFIVEPNQLGTPAYAIQRDSKLIQASFAAMDYTDLGTITFDAIKNSQHWFFSSAHKTVTKADLVPIPVVFFTEFPSLESSDQLTFKKGDYFYISIFNAFEISFLSFQFYFEVL